MSLHTGSRGSCATGVSLHDLRSAVTNCLRGAVLYEDAVTPLAWWSSATLALRGLIAMTYNCWTRPNGLLPALLLPGVRITRRLLRRPARAVCALSAPP